MVTICILSLILLIWFRTEAWVDYTRLFHLNFLSFYKDYDAKQYQDVTLTYQIYLRRFHNCFFVRLITCPICVAVWLSLAVVFFKAILLTFLIILGGGDLVTYIELLLSIVLTVPINILASLLVYGVIDRVLI